MTYGQVISVVNDAEDTRKALRECLNDIEESSSSSDAITYLIAHAADVLNDLIEIVKECKA